MSQIKDGILKDEYSVNSYDINFNSRLTFTSILKMLQETAWNHAKALHVGFDNLQETDNIWVLNRLNVEINSYPKWEDVIFVETWPVKIEKLFAIRDFSISNENGDIIGNASSSWLIINQKTRRPVRFEQFAQGMPFVPEKRSLNANPEKIDELTEPQHIASYQAMYSDIDLHRHVNNSVFARWIIDSYDFDFLKKNVIDHFEINFLSESKYGDKIIVNNEKKQDEKNIYLHNIIREQDGKELCRVRIRWKTTEKE